MPRRIEEARNAIAVRVLQNGLDWQERQAITDALNALSVLKRERSPHKRNSLSATISQVRTHKMVCCLEKCLSTHPLCSSAKMFCSYDMSEIRLAVQRTRRHQKLASPSWRP